MFSERLNALMNIAEVSNSTLGRKVHLSPSYIGRLRSGERPLPKNHEYINSICRYLADRMKKDYQMNALNHLLDTDFNLNDGSEAVAEDIEQWLLGESDPARKSSNSDEFLFGNEGKRKAVEKFFTGILQEKKPQTLLLFSDEDMSWLYEDDSFAARWADLFKQVILRGNRVKIIHTISRDINEMMEAIRKWLPIYATGMVEPYFYPRLKDGIIRRTLFIAPRTAAIASSSIQQDTSGMLNQFITNAAAIDALQLEFERYYSLCLPMMTILTDKEKASHLKAFDQTDSSADSSIIQAKLPAALRDNISLYIKENKEALLVKKTEPKAVFLINAQNLVSALWDYFSSIG